MENRTNTIAGWVLAGCGAALGLTIVGGMIYDGEKPAKEGYPVEAAEEGGDTAAAEVPIATLLGAADPAKGADVFKKCAACHTVDQGGANGIGPNLYGTVGEAIAQGKAGFAFSDALKAKSGKWDFDSLSAWLTSPRKYAPGTKMTFAGLSSAQDRANVIVYLNSQGSNIPLPPPPAAAAAGAKPGTGGPAGPAGKTGGDGTAPIAPDKGAATVGSPAIGAPSKDPQAAIEGAKAPAATK
ncbi:c-type cytochrome [uncultured Sphingomonas sp.]|uniref:c-type cytochrome n=1 Tax=uncultured Sphingomonas sp. TaxID=158754 RepID=UPI0035CA9347